MKRTGRIGVQSSDMYRTYTFSQGWSMRIQISLFKLQGGSAGVRGYNTGISQIHVGEMPLAKLGENN